MPPREFMAATLFVKMPLIGTPSAEWCSKDKFSPQEQLRVITELLEKPEVGSFSSLIKQPATPNK
jgi:hypothetical protein